MKQRVRLADQPTFRTWGCRAITVLLEFVTGPKGPIVQVAARLCLLQKAASIENSVIRLKPQMAIRLPPNFRPGPVSNESGATPVCGANQKPRDGIDAIVKAFAPLNNPIERCRDAMRERCFHVGVNVDEVNRSGARRGQNAKVVSLGKERIKGAQRVCLWMVTCTLSH